MDLELRKNVINNLSVHTEQVFVRLVFILIDIPIGVHVIGIHTVPVLVLSVGSLVVLEPSLVIRSSEGHEVFADIGFVISKSRTVLYILMHVVDIEIEIYGSEGCVSTQGQGITTHVRVRENVPVTHIGVRKTQPGLARVHGDDRGIIGGETHLEEISRVIGNNEEGVFLTVIITQHQTSVSFRTPGFIGVADRIDIVLSLGTHTIDLLYIVPFAELAIERERTIVLNAPFGIAGSCFLGGDKDHTVAGTGTIERCGGRTFQN